MSNIETLTNRILWGDCIQVLRDFPQASIDLVVTDPPYLVNYRSREGRGIANDSHDNWLKPAFRAIYRVLKPNSYCVCFYGWNKVEKFMLAWKEAGFAPVSHFVWVKPYASRIGFTKAHHEQAYLLAKGNPARPHHPPEDVFYNWRYTGNRLHPTQKPVEALLPLIRAYSRPGGIVLDPFAGSGATAVAASQAGRKAIGIELDWHFCQVANGRLIHGEQVGSPELKSGI